MFHRLVTSHQWQWGNSGPAAESLTVTQTAGVRAQLTADSCDLKQATLPGLAVKDIVWLNNSTSAM